MASDPTTVQDAQPPTGGPVSLSGLTMAGAQDQALVSDVSTVAPPGGTTSGTPVAVVQDTPMDKTRQRLAYVLLGTLLFIIAIELVFSTYFAGMCWATGACDAKAEPAAQILSGAIQPMFTAMIGLVGSVVGFYFGSKNS